MTRSIRYFMTAAAAAALAAALTAGCSSQDASADAAETAAVQETAESEASAESIREANDMEKDAVKISLLDPVRPDDMGTVTSLVYKGLEITAPYAEEVTEDDVDAYLTDYILPYLDSTVEDGTVEDGDTVNIDFTGYIDGETFDGGTGESYDLVIGSGSFIDGFEEGLIGASSGDTVSLELTFPEDYWSGDLAGQDVVFETVINSITRSAGLEDFDDEDAKTVMDDDTATVESVRQYIREYLEKLADITAKNALYTNALSAALEASEVEPTEETIEWELDVTVQSYDASLKLQGLTLAYYLYIMGSSYDDFREELEADIYESACEAVLRYAICDAEGLEFNDESIAKYIEAFGYTQEDYDTAAESFDQELSVMWYLAAQAVVDYGTVTYTDAEETAE